MYLNYEESKIYVIKLNLKSKKEWVVYSKSKRFPKFLYKRPDSSFDEFEGYPVFLGYSNVVKKNKTKKTCLSFKDAHEFVLKLKLNSQNEWYDWFRTNRPNNIPCSPNNFYKKEWRGYAHWLGNSNIKPGKIDYYSYNECKNIITINTFKNRKSFYEWVSCSNDIRIPKRPDHVYKKIGWVNWDHFLNIENPSPRNKSNMIISYNDAIEYLKDKNLKNYDDYTSYVKENKIHFLPLRPDYVYRKDWCGYLAYLSKDCSDRQSYGEYVVEKNLKESNIFYIKEHIFDTCKNINPLPFDFYLPNENMCIEFDGELHFKPIDIFGGDETFERIKSHDLIKTNWCLNNKVKLIRISYKQTKEIKNIILNILN